MEMDSQNELKGIDYNGDKEALKTSRWIGNRQHYYGKENRNYLYESCRRVP